MSIRTTLMLNGSLVAKEQPRNGSINKPSPMVRGENKPIPQLSKLNAILFRRQLVKTGDKSC